MKAERRLTQRDADELLKAMLVFSRTVEHVLEDRVVSAAGEHLSKSKVQILRLLGQRGTQTSTRIARFLGTSKPAVTQMMDSMVKSRLVAREPSPHDRRGVVLRLTARGRKCFQRILDEQRHMIRNAVRLTRSGDFECWVKILQEMARALAKADRTFLQFCLQCGAHADGGCVLIGGNADCLFLKKQAKATSALRSGKIRTGD